MKRVAHGRFTMKIALILILVLAINGLHGCATSPKGASSADASNRGDRELKRGVYWYQKGCSRKALDHFHAAHEYYCLSDRQTRVARSLNSLANVYRYAGDLDGAHLFYDAAIAAARRSDDQTEVAQALSNKASLFIHSGELATAEVLLDEAQLSARETGSVFAMVLNHRALLAMKAGYYDEAGNLLDQADSIASGEGINATAAIHFTRGRLMMKTGDYPQAMDHFQQALEMDRQAGFSRGMADDLAAMADLHELSGEDEAALDCLDRSIKIQALLENRPKVIESLDRLESLAGKTGNDVRVTIHFVKRWLAGETVDAICR